MKSSIFIASLSAALAVAGPVEKRAVVTDVVVEYYTVTVTGDAPTTTAKPTFFVNGGKHRSRSTTVAPVPTTTTAAPVVVVTQTEEAAPVAPESTTVVEEPTTTAEEPTYVATTAQQAVATPSDMASTAVYAHNIHRSNHSAPAVAWLDEIAGYAENTANTCTFAHDMTQGSGNYGQNIAMWASSDGAAALGAAGAINMATTKMWYNGEVNGFLPSYYGQATPDMSDFESWGHFSQLVWKDTTDLGCYAKLCEKGTMYQDMDAWYMVCNYRPAGNMGGAYGTNVLQSLGEATVDT